MITAKQLHKIAKTVQEQGYDYDYVGLRIQESDYGLTVGQAVTHQSQVWIDGEETDEQIDGICAVDTDAAADKELSFGAYFGHVVLVLGSNRGYWGEDDGEVILQSNPTILDIINL